MRINDLNLTGTTAAETAHTEKVDRFESGGASRIGGAGGDRVELSSTLGRLSKALEALQSDRVGKLAQLTAQYQSGNYRVDSTTISRRMVAEALDSRDSTDAAGY